LIFPNLDAATAAFKVLAELGQAHVVGPVLLGAERSVHPLPPGADAHAVLLLGALATVEAQARERPTSAVSSPSAGR
ncbi:MAG TPA: phosphate acyltransferase, partial [Chloroflexota bacterium]|nr:phosphate acyltransferase [Chloroflexota bacterium]